MPKATISEKLVWALKERGCSELPSSSTKFRKFLNPSGDPSLRFYWVGKAGALRHGRTVTESVPTETTKANLLRRWEAAHAPKATP